MYFRLIIKIYILNKSLLWFYLAANERKKGAFKNSKDETEKCSNQNRQNKKSFKINKKKT